MTNKETYQPVLDWFTEKMGVELGRPENVAKGHWGNDTVVHLLARLVEEVGELMAACSDWYNPSMKSDTPDKITEEAADVANFAMMIADNTRRWSGLK